MLLLVGLLVCLALHWLFSIADLTLLGRMNANGFVPAVPYVSKYRDTASSTTNPVRPEEVLFRRQNAPVRYEETDYYFAHENLPPSCPLPGSELLESIHAYSADFYDHATMNKGQEDYQTLDETALIAMGVLMEEIAKESLGETGDLVLVEGEEVSEREGQPSMGFQRRLSRKRESSTMASSGDNLEDVVKRKRRSKKPRITPRASSAGDMDTEPDAPRTEPAD